MEPIEMLISEHRLIEKIIDVIQLEMFKIEKGRIIDESILDSIVDFLKSYINTTHHEKEDILFGKLKNKPITEDELKIMQQLINEHKYMKNAITDIVNAEIKYFKGEDAIGILITTFSALIALYPKHIQKEEEVFFPNIEKYFTDDELASILKEFEDLDRTMIHKKYKSLIQELKTRK